jgi:hypothetical protein
MMCPDNTSRWGALDIDQHGELWPPARPARLMPRSE